MVGTSAWEIFVKSAGHIELVLILLSRSARDYARPRLQMGGIIPSYKLVFLTEQHACLNLADGPLDSAYLMSFLSTGIKRHFSLLG